ncbi:hypothetical protein QQF64_001231, partial [Cirrhinus molitorella]
KTLMHTESGRAVDLTHSIATDGGRQREGRCPPPSICTWLPGNTNKSSGQPEGCSALLLATRE